MFFCFWQIGTTMSAGEEFPQLTGGTPTRKERQQMAAANSKSPASTPTRQQHAAPRSPASTPERRQPTQQHQQHQQQQHQQNQQNQQQRNSPRVSHSNSGNSAGNNSRAAAPQLDDFEQFFVGTASLIGDIDSRMRMEETNILIDSNIRFAQSECWWCCVSPVCRRAQSFTACCDRLISFVSRKKKNKIILRKEKNNNRWCGLACNSEPRVARLH
jgi:hypothetical protein